MSSEKTSRVKRGVALLALSLPLLLAACGGSASVPTTPAAKSGTVNGVRVLDTKTYQLGVSALDDASTVVKTATISNVSVSELSSGQVTVNVCGQIQAQDVLTTAITLDSTGSMSVTDPNNVRQQAAKAFVGRMGAGDRAAVLSFDTSTAATAGLNFAHLWQDFSSDKALLTTGIANATFAGGGTPLYSAVVDASTLLSKTSGTNKNVLLLTDGDDNSSTDTVEAAIAAAKQSGARVFAVGLDSTDSLDFTALEQIATQTGGLFRKASDAAQLTSYFDNMFNAVTAQGCVQLNFTTLPTSGSVVTGKLNLTVSSSGKADTKLMIPFSFTAR